MGGRGGSSGISGGSLKNGFNGQWFGISYTSNGKQQELYIRQTSQGVLMMNGLGKSPMSLKSKAETIVNNAKNNYSNVKIISPIETKKLMDERNEKIRKSPDYEMGLGTPWGNRANRRAARESRLASRRRR